MIFCTNLVPELELFERDLNAQVPCYVSWFPDPNAFVNDAFTISLGKKNIMLFLHLGWLGQHLGKLERLIICDHGYSFFKITVLVPTPSNAANPSRLSNWPTTDIENIDFRKLKLLAMSKELPQEI